MHRYGDEFVSRLVNDIGALILDETVDAADVHDRLCHLAEANSTVVAEYWRTTKHGRGIPDSAFKDAQPYLFSDQPPARTFHTSGTTGPCGRASYSPSGLELMKLSILENARRNLLSGLDRPAVVRLVPTADAAPHMVMAWGMEAIANAFGHPELSATVVDRAGIDYAGLIAALDDAIEEDVPVVLIGASFAFVNLCEELDRQGRRFELPSRSRVMDAGGFKGRSRAVAVDDLRALLRRSFGIADGGFVNLFGMTELASQLYDSVDEAAGPLGERPKGGTRYAWPRVLDAVTLTAREGGRGLLEVVDLCLIDRPPAVLTGDLALATPHGAAIIGRVERGRSRGCSLTLDDYTSRELVHA